jgi:hypothetical protein
MPPPSHVRTEAVDVIAQVGRKIRRIIEQFIEVVEQEAHYLAMIHILVFSHLGRLCNDKNSFPLALPGAV